MSSSQDTSLCHWLARFQRLDMTEEQVSDPAKTAEKFAHMIGDTAEGMAFDTDPAMHGKLLHDLAPDDLKSGGSK
jgi:hypothetical protein